MKYKEKSGFNRSELRFYRLCGVMLFRSFLLKSEKAMKKRFENYHFAGKGIISLMKFRGYLFFNGTVHTVNLALGLAGIFFIHEFFYRNIVFTVVIISSLIINLYCIMLQRYNYIILRDSIFRELRDIEIKARDAAEKIPPEKIIMLKDSDFALIEEISESVKTGRNIYIRKCHLKCLERLASAAEYSCCAYAEKEDKKELDDLEKLCSLYPALSSKKAEAASYIMKNNGPSPLSCCAIITENKECEKALIKVFPVLSPEAVLYTCEMLLNLKKTV